MREGMLPSALGPPVDSLITICRVTEGGNKALPLSVQSAQLAATTSFQCILGVPGPQAQNHKNETP